MRDRVLTTVFLIQLKLVLYDYFLLTGSTTICSQGQDGFGGGRGFGRGMGGRMMAGRGFGNPLCFFLGVL